MKRVIAITLILTAILSGFSRVCAEERVFVLCNPESFVIVHRNPKMTSEKAGRLECGEYALTDGKKKNGFLHILNVTEYGEGWIYTGYVVHDQPTIRDAVACVAASGKVRARRCINGQRIAWLKVGTEVRVYAMSEEWAVTDRGFVNREYLEVWYE